MKLVDTCIRRIVKVGEGLGKPSRDEELSCLAHDETRNCVGMCAHIAKIIAIPISIARDNLQTLQE